MLGLIADIGGTNARFALADLKNDVICNELVLPTQDFKTFDDALAHYFINEAVDVDGLVGACIAVAGPVQDGYCRMTNLPWILDNRRIKDTFGWQSVDVINDFAAQAYACINAKESQRSMIGDLDVWNVQEERPVVITGPGTGLGVAQAVKFDGVWRVIPSEGGHVEFAPINDLDRDIQKVLQTKYDRVSVERLVSGLGIENIYFALTFLQGDVIEKSAQEIATSDDETCQQAMGLFFEYLGRFAGDLALTASAQMVVIAGGICQKNRSKLATSKFRTAFSQKGRFQETLLNTPTWLLSDNQPGLNGAKVCLQQKIKQIRNEND